MAVYYNRLLCYIPRMSVKHGFVYFLTNFNNRVLYIGVTSNLQKRLFEHRTKVIEGFTAKYNLTKLVYFEQCGNINDAIYREKQLKGWLRKKKNELVNAVNPEWRDLSLDWESKLPDVILRRNDEGSAMSLKLALLFSSVTESGFFYRL